jgi:hypothetical protein
VGDRAAEHSWVGVSAANPNVVTGYSRCLLGFALLTPTYVLPRTALLPTFGDGVLRLLPGQHAAA